jgi:hypothetical protein
MEGDMGQRVDQMEERLLQAMNNLMAARQADPGQSAAAIGAAATNRSSDVAREQGQAGNSGDASRFTAESSQSDRAKDNRKTDEDVDDTKAKSSTRPRSRGNRERDRGKRYNVGPRFSDSEDTEDLAQYAGMPWHQAGVRGRTKVRNAELFQMAQQAQEEQTYLQRELDIISEKRAKLRRDMTKADDEARRPGLHSQEYRQARDRAEAVSSELQIVTGRLADLAGRLRTMRDENTSRLQARRKELGCSSLDSVNAYGHPGTSTPFDIKAMPMFEGKPGEDPEEWEQRVRDLCHEYNLYGRKLNDFMDQRIGPNVKKAMQGFYLRPERERSDPSQWLSYFPLVYPVGAMQTHYMHQFTTLTQAKGMEYSVFLNQLRYAYAKAWPGSVALEHDPEGVKRIAYRFYEGMDVGPGGRVKTAAYMYFYMQLPEHLRKPPEELFATLLRVVQNSWELENVPALDGRGMGQEVKPRPAGTPVLPANPVPGSTCLHCGGSHLPRRCPQAAQNRKETLKMIVEDNAFEELPPADRDDLLEDTVAALAEIPEEQQRSIVCFELF